MGRTRMSLKVQMNGLGRLSRKKAYELDTTEFVLQKNVVKTTKYIP
jgi:hypothetical protein